jgi:hypothetical protein
MLPILTIFSPGLAGKGLLTAHRILTWEDELLFVFVVVGCLEKKENGSE